MLPRIHITIFFLVNLFLCSWHMDSGPNDNTMGRALAVSSLVEHGSLEITAHHTLTGDKAIVHGRYFSDKAPLPTLIVAPAWWLARALGSDECGDDQASYAALLRIGGFLCGSVPLALIITLVWLLLRTKGTRWSFAVAMLPLYGSFLFVYSGSFYNHLPAALFLLIAVERMHRGRPLIAGIWAGAAFACEASIALIIALWAIQLLVKRTGVVRFLIGLVPAIALTFIHNAIVTGSPIVFPSAFAANYEAMHTGYGFGTWQPAAFWGLTFSPYRGLFFYAPALLALLYLAWIRRKDLLSRVLLLNPCYLPAFLLVIAFFTHATWWAGWTYGPRYLTAAAALLLYGSLPVIARKPGLARATLILSLFGLLCALAAKSTVGYSLPTEVARPMTEIVWPALIDGRWTAMQWPALLGVPISVATCSFPLIFALGLFTLMRLDRQSSSTHP